ncbi:histidine kinase, partial [Pseudomonadota bacterium]
MKPSFKLKDIEQESLHFDSLMPFKVKNILIISSLYDLYNLREDGRLTNLLLSEYADLRLSSAPAIKRVDSGSSALDVLQDQSFDLIIVFRSLADIESTEFSRRVKLLTPDTPVVLLAFHHRELEIMRDRGCDAFDDIFFWSGESRMLLTIIKYVEDKKNVEADTELVGVRVIILVENSVRFYSSFLPLIYTEIMQQTSALLSESINSANRLLRMRARPKILLAENYEDALFLFNKYKKYLLGVVSDIQFSKGGQINENAGLQLAAAIKEQISDLPVLLQSSDETKAEQAAECNADFLNKRSPTLLKKLSRFINQNFGFGAFIFRLPDGTELARASNFREMQRCVARISIESLLYHAERNHFSNWLMARTEFELAARLRPRRASEFDSPKDMRAYLVDTLKEFRHERQVGVVTDFSRGHYDGHAEFLRIGDGSLGGKGRGLAFVNNLVNRFPIHNAFPGTRISVPRSAVICTGYFDQFMKFNDLTLFALEDHSDEEVIAAFSSAKIPPELEKDLKSLLAFAKYP